MEEMSKRPPHGESSIRFDRQGAWRLGLAGEVKNAGCQIDLNNTV